MSQPKSPQKNRTVPSLLLLLGLLLLPASAEAAIHPHTNRLRGLVLPDRLVQQESTEPVFVRKRSIGVGVKYWVGGTAGNFTPTPKSLVRGFTDANRWALTSGGTDYTTTPGSADVATFDGGGTANCTITADPNVGGIDIKSGYAGTISQVARRSLGRGLGLLTQAGGFQVRLGVADA